jgi:hypothetical protein
MTVAPASGGLTTLGNRRTYLLQGAVVKTSGKPINGRYIEELTN